MFLWVQNLIYHSTFVFSLVLYNIILDSVEIRFACTLIFVSRNENSQEIYLSATILYVGQLEFSRKCRPWQSNFIKFLDWFIGLFLFQRVLQQ